MLLDVSKAFLNPGAAFPFEAKVQLPPQDVMGETVSWDEALLQGTFTVLEDEVHLKGTLTGMAHAACALCLGQADVPLRLSFSEVFRKDAGDPEDEAFPYEGKAVSLDQMALTLMMLSLPMRFVCKADCKGTRELQAWQKDVSKSSCEDGLPTQRPFEALQHLLKKDEEV
jgi:uncharacterized protein